LQNVAKRHLSKKIRVTNDDFFRADLSRATVITFYLDSFADRKLKAKLEEETSPGTRIVSHDFSMPG
jgi:predicted transposase YdaD